MTRQIVSSASSMILMRPGRVLFPFLSLSTFLSSLRVPSNSFYYSLHSNRERIRDGKIDHSSRVQKNVRSFIVDPGEMENAEKDSVSEDGTFRTLRSRSAGRMATNVDDHAHDVKRGGVSCRKQTPIPTPEETLKGMCIDGSTFSRGLKEMVEWSEWRDLNPRPLPPQGSTLTRLRHTQTVCGRRLYQNYSKMSS